MHRPARTSALSRVAIATRVREHSTRFREGRPADAIYGPTSGIRVALFIEPVVDKVARVATGAWMPWLGKRFDRSAARSAKDGAMHVQDGYGWVGAGFRRDGVRGCSLGD